MKNFAIALLLVALTASFSSCKKDLIGEGPISTETRSITNFNSIDLQMNGNVYFKNDPQWKVEISARQSILPILETQVINKKLVINIIMEKRTITMKASVST